ncbi:HPr kinase/phosphorylase [Phosphitispora sp. TUW77]|uniref:HPr kinase/phosphorylase n=1 Tax=Phosphitispora sp. TUW77 TaxID=3152361 RepID=UPI003AB4FC24
MIVVATKMVYKAFGMKLLSEIPFPELHQICGNGNMADVVIEISDLTGLWSKLALRDEKIIYTPELIMFQLHDTAIFCIREGKKITVSPLPEFDVDMVRVYILGTCMGVLLLQRKVLPLHGSAVAINGRAYGFIGDSGTGKSTLAAAFISRGYQLVSDDVLAVSVSHEGIPLITPSYPQQKLWQESLNELGMKADRYRHIYQREHKFAVPVPEDFFTEPLPLAGLFELLVTGNETLEIRRIERLERLRTIYYQTYRKFLISRLALMEWHFKTSANIADRIDMFQLRRPCAGFTAPHLASLILSTINQEEE